MNRITRFNILFLLMTLSASAVAQGWMNDLLVHRRPSFTENGAESCMLCHSGEKMREVAKGAHGDSENPLTPRVLANRLWHYHFGTGIVDTPSDFGYM